ncbi:MAG TPA: sulfotransferase domain-containing protein [Marmoricola sp.]|nr:sulfotransferase domain-containing protein [Marmoricola sp.]
MPKAGTGSLYSFLAQHPDICPSNKKEVGYWNYYNPRRNTGPVPPLGDYLKHFSGWCDERYAVEATPNYSYGGRPVIEAIRSGLERPRIILVLRDPVRRLWSEFTFQRELGNLLQFPSFDDYLEACERRKRDGSDLVPKDHMHGLYIGYYGDYVPLWLDAFGPDIKVLFTENLADDPVGVMRDVLRWLEIDDEVAERLDLDPRNPTLHPRSTRLAHLAYSLKKSAERRSRVARLVRARTVREPVRRLYHALNAGKPPPHMLPSTRRHVEQLYAESNAQTREALRRHGYDHLPPWLLTAEASR